MTTHAGLSDDRVEAIIANHDADPANGDDSHTPREVVQLAREVKARRAADREARHALRNALAPFASATETALCYADAGRLDLARAPGLREDLERCRRSLRAMETEDQGAAGPGEVS